MKVIVINGSGGVGKSTFIKLCKEVNPNVVELSIIDFVKQIATELGWNGGKTEKDRKFLSDLKDLIDEYNPNFLYDRLSSDMMNYEAEAMVYENFRPIFFINARTPKDIEYLVNAHNAISVMVTNINVPQVVSNHADKNVYDYKYDYYIDNSSDLDCLKVLATLFMSNLEK